MGLISQGPLLPSQVLKKYWKDWKRHPSDPLALFEFAGNKVRGMLSVQRGEGWEASLKGTGTVRQLHWCGRGFILDVLSCHCYTA